MENKKMTKFNRWYIYVCCFFVFCFVGWLYEVGWGIRNSGGNIMHGLEHRGYLHGCYLPIYGFGGITLLLCLEELMKKKIKIWKITLTPLVVFVAIILIVSAIEFAVSWVMELIYHRRWWDYSSDFLNIDGRVSLRNSTLLAIGGMFFLYILYPLLNKLFSKILPMVLKVVAILIILVMSTDFIFVLAGK